MAGRNERPAMANDSKPDAATDANLVPPPAINTKATLSRSDSTKDSPILGGYVPVARSRDHNDWPSMAVTDERSVVPSSPSFDTPQGGTVLAERLPELNNTGELSPMPESDGV
ncbi:aldehyde dehydrogenase (NAD(P)(+)) ald5 [Pestalotiopsis sp. IQ-011]